MYFPEDMNFQYFFFNTYIGYFLQLIPVALIAGLACFFIRRKRKHREGTWRTLLASLFIAYLSAVVTITLFQNLLGDIYYWLFYHRPSGRIYRWFEFVYSFRLDFFRHLTMENLFNVVLFLPFGILYPFFDRNAGWKKTLGVGVLTSLAIELIQPILGRSFDINDIALNSIGVLLSTGIFFGIWALTGRRARPQS